MTWRVFAVDVRCGSCDGSVAAGEPVALLTERRLPRCPRCAGADVDWTQIDASMLALERDALEGRPGAGRVTRVRPQPPRPFAAIAAELPFDPKAAAAQPDGGRRS